ncbi:hypothetical protein DFP80_11145 [Marinomonas rhizomae]|uniref:Uncharacterized protein n=1 Tax=Marinomonas rhizomae TaxID=491948 RepID=A0A366J0R3_9GAMM|nr:hypothetical protein DFP80_11145 [Marinomonas rhizomae]
MNFAFYLKLDHRDLQVTPLFISLLGDFLIS